MRAFLSLGSNLGDRAATIRGAIENLADVVGVSPVYETDPVGGPEQGAFLNVVVELDTSCSPRELLERCRAAEESAGRVRSERWGPRTLDVDVLLVGDLVVDEEDLQVPHPRMWQRRFVLAPLRDLAPDLVTPDALDAAEGAVRRLPVVRVIGSGRAGGALSAGLKRRGWNILPPLGRGDDLARAGEGVDLLVIATPDDRIGDIGAAVEPVVTTVVAHLAGSMGPDVLHMHPRRCAVHPLISIPTPETNLSGAWFAIAGDPMARRVVEALDGRAFTVADEHRAAYHAAACIAANHLVALFGQVERVCTAAGVPLDPLLDLAQGALDQVRALGPAAALTGPAGRGDEATLARHLAALDPSEHAAYEALSQAAKRLATHRTA